MFLNVHVGQQGRTRNRLIICLSADDRPLDFASQKKFGDDG
jgi:hypothetical protein